MLSLSWIQPPIENSEELFSIQLTARTRPLLRCFFIVRKYIEITIGRSEAKQANHFSCADSTVLTGVRPVGGDTDSKSHNKMILLHHNKTGVT